MPKAFRSVRYDFTSSNGFRWPFPGERAVAPKPKGRAYSTSACPSFIGDGLCLAKTAAGAASGGIPMHTVLICEYRRADVLAEDTSKIRVKSCKVLEVLDFPALLRAGLVDEEVRANLRGADGTEQHAASSTEQALDALGIDWPMSWREVAEAIPPAYTEHLGSQLLCAVQPCSEAA